MSVSTESLNNNTNTTLINSNNLKNKENSPLINKINEANPLPKTISAPSNSVAIEIKDLKKSQDKTDNKIDGEVIPQIRKDNLSKQTSISPNESQIPFKELVYPAHELQALEKKLDESNLNNPPTLNPPIPQKAKEVVTAALTEVKPTAVKNKNNKAGKKKLGALMLRRQEQAEAQRKKQEEMAQRTPEKQREKAKNIGFDFNNYGGSLTIPKHLLVTKNPIVERDEIPLESEFSLKDMTKHNDYSILDPIKYAEDFRGRKNGRYIGQNHMTKRLELFGTMCVYIQDKGPHLANYTFNQKGLHTNQFKATSYVVPDLGHSQGYERTHISLLNKLIVQEIDAENSAIKQMSGDIKFNGMTLALDHLFNLCDIAPTSINAIDGYIEDNLRLPALDMLEQIKNGKLKAEEAKKQMKSLCKKYLEALQTEVSKKNSKQNEKIKIIRQDLDHENYIKGMLAALY